MSNLNLWWSMRLLTRKRRRRIADLIADPIRTLQVLTHYLFLFNFYFIKLLFDLDFYLYFFYREFRKIRGLHDVCCRFLIWLLSVRYNMGLFGCCVVHNFRSTGIFEKKKLFSFCIWQPSLMCSLYINYTGMQVMFLIFELFDKCDQI